MHLYTGRRNCRIRLCTKEAWTGLQLDDITHRYFLRGGEFPLSVVHLFWCILLKAL
jgi:hypothetical protein